MTLTASVSNFIIKNIEVFVIFDGESIRYKGEIYWPGDSFKMKFGSEDMFLKIPPSKHISSLTALQPGVVTEVIMPFIVEKQPFKFFSQLGIVFTNYKGDRSTIRINKKDIERVLQSKKTFIVKSIS